MKSSGALSVWKSGSSHLLRVLLISLSAAVCCSALMAQSPATQQPADAVSEVPAEGLSQRQALERVRARFPGNIISINEVNQEGQIRFRIRIDNEGNIYTVYVDQATGAITRE